MNKLNLILGVSRNEREVYDYYATEPQAVDALLEHENFNQNIWECACGGGHISERLVAHGYTVKSTDLINRGYGQSGVDFLKQEEVFDGDIITNPPYKYAEQFVLKALSLVKDGSKVAMFLRIQFLEGLHRYKFFKDNPPKFVYVATKRLGTAKGGEFEKYKAKALCYAWFVWEKGYKGEPRIRWCNTN